MKTTLYRDTRALDNSRPAFSEVLVRGIAEGGGLFVPDRLPEMSLEDVLVFADWPYWRRAAALYTRFGVDVSSERVDSLMRRAYGDNFAHPRVAPVREVRPGMHVLELWHGPTSAFKDMALQCMPLFFSEAIETMQARGVLSEDFLVLVATSGDTGKAAMEGFADRAHTRIAVFYPAEGVSEIQRLQMVTQRGSNVAVFGVRGNFDDCQGAVKAAFGDVAFAESLGESRGLRLSSANSINWGRLMPQVVYYVSAYADLVSAGAMRAGEPMDVCVPTGNFGNILGAYYAKHMGVPIDRLLCASNENNVLAEFIATGTYDISERRFVTTPSPSMDILVSSNLERLLFDLAGGLKTREWMRQLSEERLFKVDMATFTALRKVLLGDHVTNEDSLSTIRRVWSENRYLLDPHTAVAWEVAERLAGPNPLLVVSTAHWAKFAVDVYKALGDIPYADELPDSVRALSGMDVLAEVERLAPGAAPIPQALASLREAPARFSEVIDAGRDSVEEAITGWLGA